MSEILDRPQYKWKDYGNPAFKDTGVEISVNNAISVYNLSGTISAGNNVLLNGGTFTNDGAPEAIKLTGLSDNNKLIENNNQITPKELDGYKINTDIINPNKPNSTKPIENTENVEIEEVKTPPFQYMYENRLEFVDLSKYYGSEYFFDRIGYNPEKDAPIVLVGDAYVETKIITKKIEEILGNHYVAEGIYSDADQVAYMYENAAKEKEELNLTVGVKLTAEQVSKLTSDIIWLEEQEINGIKVLVPQVYIRKLTIDNIAMMGNSIVARKNIVAQVDSFQNSGYVKAGETVQIKAKDITNSNGGAIIGNNVQLIADNNINIEVAEVFARNKVILNAGKDVNIKAKAVSEEKHGNGIIKTVTNYGMRQRFV